MPDISVNYPRFKIKKSLRLIELFAGYGSQAMALRNIGADFERHYVCEFDSYAIKSYNAVHGTSFETSDIRNLHWGDLKIDEKEKYDYLMFYSFPCTDISQAGGKKGMEKGSDTRSGLLWEVWRLLKELAFHNKLPQVLIMENVPQVNGVKNRDSFNFWKDFLNLLGYQNYFKILDSQNFGVPQRRKRAYMVSILGYYSFTFPEQLGVKATIDDILEKNPDSKYFVSANLNSLLLENSKKKGIALQPGLVEYVKDDINGKFGKSKDAYVKNISVSSTCVSTYYKGIDGVGKSAVIVAPTCTSSYHLYQNHCAGVFESNLKIRKLTSREFGRLMGVSDEDITKMQLQNSDTQLYKQFGNSIVVSVLESIFRELY